MGSDGSSTTLAPIQSRCRPTDGLSKARATPLITLAPSYEPFLQSVWQLLFDMDLLVAGPDTSRYQPSSITQQNDPYSVLPLQCRSLSKCKHP